MSEKRYPTRMHEVLGVEPEERFMYSDYGDREFCLSESGLMYRICDDGTSIPTTQGTLVLFINNHERITRRHRLTEEQVEALTALYRVFGCKWLVYDEKRNLSLASKRKPSRTESVGEWDFKGVTLDVWLSDVLTAFAPQGAPLDIVQTLKDAGVEVEG